MCNAGFQNVGYTSTFAGTCTACTGLPYGQYWTTPSSYSYVCNYLPQSICLAGQYNPSFSSTSAGSCSGCSTVTGGFYYIANTNVTMGCITAACSDASCNLGQYISLCTGTFAGTCAACLNPITSSQEYTGKGSWTGTCPVLGCPLNCPTGQWTSGCGSISSATSCSVCTNSVPNVNYYVAGTSGYNSTSCPTTTCPVCANGNYLMGCGNISSGVCTQCTNS